MHNEKKLLIYKLDILDIILAIGVITAPMTSLRTWKIGISEFFIAIWSIIILMRCNFKIKLDQFNKFFIIYGTCMFIGYLIRVSKNIYTGSATNEALTIIFFTLFVFALSSYFQKQLVSKVIRLLQIIFIWGFIIYFGLYLYSIFISRTFLGYSLWYGNRLSILSNNPHQFVFFIGPSMIIGVCLLKIKAFKTKLGKLFAILFIIGYFYMGLQTKSSTLYATLFIILNYVIFFKESLNASAELKKMYLVGMKISLIIIFFILFYKQLYIGFYNFMKSDDNGLVRLYLWQRGIQTALNHPIFGLGPGAHLVDFSNYSFMEAHNTYIDIMLRGGIISLYEYILMMLKSIRVLKNDVCGRSVLMFFIIYGIAGYIVRRITLWFFIIAVTYLYKNITEKKVVEKQVNIC